MRISKKLKKKLFKSMKNGNIEFILLVNDIIKKNNLDLISSDGNTLLHYFVCIAKKKIIKLLLEEGANPNIKNKYGNTPLSEAINYKFFNLFKLFLEYNVDVFIEDSKGNSPFDMIKNYSKENFDLIYKRIHEVVLDVEDANSIILNLDVFKLLGILSMEEHSNFVSYVYKVSYEYMKLEFLYNGKSLVYEYFLSNQFDFNYVDKFISDDIDDIINSINYIEELEVLKNLIKDKDNYMNEDIVKLISKLTNPIIINKSREILEQLGKINDEFLELKEKYFNVVNSQRNNFNIFTPDDFYVLDSYEIHFHKIVEKFKKLKSSNYVINDIIDELRQVELGMLKFSSRQLGIVRVGRSL